MQTPASFELNKQVNFGFMKAYSRQIDQLAHDQSLTQVIN